MFEKKDLTYRNICERSLKQWLEEMEQHEDLAVRGGVKLARDYIAMLEKEKKELEEKSAMKDDFLRKMKKKQLELKNVQK